MDESKDMSAIGLNFSIFEHDVRTNPFGSNQSAHRVYRRTERVVAALYLITNHIPPTDPARNSIRAQCAVLLAKALALREDMSTVDSPSARELREVIRYLISLVRMLTVARLLSMRNAQVAIEALDDLGAFIEVSKSSPMSEHVSITKEDLLDIRRGSLMDIKDDQGIKDISLIKDKVTISNSRRSGLQLGVREQHVLSVLTGAGELGIRDIVSSLPEYSEKMIQRELASLVSAGRVRKSGLKRWSRYSATS